MKKSFTLIELIVVIAIIAILAAIIAPNAFKAIEKAKISKLIAMTKNLKTASLTYSADVGGHYPREYAIEHSAGHEPQVHCLSMDPNTSTLPPYPAMGLPPLGWDGPYIEKPLSHVDNPFGGSIKVEAFYTYSPTEPGGGHGFDLDGDGTLDTAPWKGSWIMFRGVNEYIAKKVNDIIDGEGANWESQGRVEYNPVPTDNHSIAIFFFDNEL